MPKALVPLALTEVQKVELKSLARLRTSAAAPVMRARMMLECADGRSNRQVALAFRVKPHAVGMWRKRFERDGRAGLLDAARSGRPATITPALKQKIVNTVCASENPATRRTSCVFMGSKSFFRKLMGDRSGPGERPKCRVTTSSELSSTPAMSNIETLQESQPEGTSLRFVSSSAITQRSRSSVASPLGYRRKRRCRFEPEI